MPPKKKLRQNEVEKNERIIDIVDDTQQNGTSSETEQESESAAPQEADEQAPQEADDAADPAKDIMPLDDMPLEETQGDPEGEALAA